MALKRFTNQIKRGARFCFLVRPKLPNAPFDDVLSTYGRGGLAVPRLDVRT